MFSPNAVVVPHPTRTTESMPLWLTSLLLDDPIGWSDWLDTFPDVHTTDDQGRTPLHWACLLRRSREAHELLTMGADPWRPDQNGTFPWELAMRWRSDAQWAWDQWPTRYPRAFVWREPHDAWRTVCIAWAVLRAAMRRRLDVVHALTQATDVTRCPGVPLVPIDKKAKAWHFLPWAHAVVMLELGTAFPLLQAWGIRLDDTDLDGRTAIQWGIALQRPEMVDLLLNAGATLVDLSQEPLTLNDEATRPEPVSLAMVLSPSMAHWISQHVRHLTPDGSMEQEVLDSADAVHGASTMARTLFHGWKRHYQGHSASSPADPR